MSNPLHEHSRDLSAAIFYREGDGIVKQGEAVKPSYGTGG
jgi:hypothetical protein